MRLLPYGPAEPLPDAVEQVLIRTVRGEELLTLTHARAAHDAYLVAFAEIADRNDAERIAGAELSIRSTALPPLQPGEFYLFELPGATLIDPAGLSLGVVQGFARGGRQDLLVVDTPQGERLLNLEGAVFVQWDRVQRRLMVELIPGAWD